MGWRSREGKITCNRWIHEGIGWLEGVNDCFEGELWGRNCQGKVRECLNERGLHCINRGD